MENCPILMDLPVEVTPTYWIDGNRMQGDAINTVKTVDLRHYSECLPLIDPLDPAKMLTYSIYRDTRWNEEIVPMSHASLKMMIEKRIKEYKAEYQQMESY